MRAISTWSYIHHQNLKATSSLGYFQRTTMWLLWSGSLFGETWETFITLSFLTYIFVLIVKVFVIHYVVRIANPFTDGPGLENTLNKYNFQKWSDIMQEGNAHICCSYSSYILYLLLSCFLGLCIHPGQIIKVTNENFPNVFDHLLHLTSPHAPTHTKTWWQQS